MPKDLLYILLLFALFVLPRALQRFRLPSAITSFVIGVTVALTAVMHTDPTIGLLATFGIASMFLIAGLEVDRHQLRTGARVVIQHVAIQGIVLYGAGYAVNALLGFEPRVAALIALALFTPSTGFILSSLLSLAVSENERFWIRTKAIATELLALGVLFVALQSTSATRLGLATAALLALIVVLPTFFRLFATTIAPYAPRSEFAFLLMLAVIAAYITRSLGVYYLVGAFIVGIAAQAFRERLPAMSSERMLYAVEAFASVFAPFYFFNAGMHLSRDELSPLAIVTGLTITAICVPIRIALVLMHRKLELKESVASGIPIAVALVPTLVFSLVIAEILRDRFALPDYLFGAIVIYAVLNTLLPGFVLGMPSVELDVLSELDTPISAEPGAGQVRAG